MHSFINYTIVDVMHNINLFKNIFIHYLLFILYYNNAWIHNSPVLKSSDGLAVLFSDKKKFTTTISERKQISFTILHCFIVVRYYYFYYQTVDEYEFLTV